MIPKVWSTNTWGKAFAGNGELIWLFDLTPCSDGRPQDKSSYGYSWYMCKPALVMLMAMGQGYFFYWQTLNILVSIYLQSIWYKQQVLNDVYLKERLASKILSVSPFREVCITKYKTNNHFIILFHVANSSISTST